MSALRRALLGSVILLGVHGAAGKARAAQPAVQQTAWADSVRQALADRGMDSDGASGAVQNPRALQKGMASWYGGRFNHRRTSSGAAFDKHGLTAAHPTAPLGSKLRVTSEETGRSVVVTVNDRGPYSRGRVIDLSRAAAAQIGMLGSGVAHVRIQAATPEEVASAPETMGDEGIEAPDTSAVTGHRMVAHHAHGVAARHVALPHMRVIHRARGHR